MATDRTKTCDSCGSVNQADATFCWTCGKSFAYTFPPVEPPPVSEPRTSPAPLPPQPPEPAAEERLAPHPEPFQPSPSEPRPPAPQPPPVYFVEPRLTKRELNPAGFWLRFDAFIIDWIILIVLVLLAARLSDIPSVAGAFSSLVSAILSPTSSTSANALVGTFFLQVVHILGAYIRLAFAVAAAYYVIFHALGGQTIGKALFRIRVERSAGGPIGWFASILRYVFFWIGTRPFLFFLGVLWIAWDPKKKGWHDHVAGTNVYRV